MPGWEKVRNWGRHGHHLANLRSVDVVDAISCRTLSGTVVLMLVLARPGGQLDQQGLGLGHVVQTLGNTLQKVQDAQGMLRGFALSHKMEVRGGVSSRATAGGRHSKQQAGKAERRRGGVK